METYERNKGDIVPMKVSGNTVSGEVDGTITKPNFVVIPDRDKPETPALFQLRNLLNGPAEKDRMDRARSLCVLAIEERARDHKEIERLGRRSLGGRIKGFFRLFTRGG